VDVAALARATTEELEGQVLGKPVTLTFHGPPSLRLDTDEAKLRQVLVNLIGNAVKFTEQGSVRVTVDASAAGLPVIAVRDSGIGIPKDRLRAIFTPFEQADSSTTRKYGGTGLGLAISRSLCELLGATLTVESSEGRGSCFTIRFQDERARAEPDRDLAVAARALSER
jgi:signal transduction histidine kinase